MNEYIRKMEENKGKNKMKKSFFEMILDALNPGLNVE